MPELTLRLRVDPTTGKREIVIDYASDADALPMEHEDEHRRLAGAVVDGGLRSGKVDVSREPDGGVARDEPSAEQPVATPTPASQK
jgi:hypothetical protein